jgi:hypothetical protein
MRPSATSEVVFFILKRKEKEKNLRAERPGVDYGEHLVWYGAADRANASNALSKGT